MAKYKIVADLADLPSGDTIASYLIDAAGAALTSTLITGKQSLDVNVVQSALPSGAATEATLAAVLAEIQSFDYADGSAWVASSIGVSSLAVRKDTAGPLTGVDNGDWTPLIVDSSGALKVTATVTFGGEYAEDSVAVSGDTGLFMLGVRRDAAGSQVSASGDYAEFQVGGTGEVRTMDVQDVAVKQTRVTLTVAGTAQKVPATALVNRKKIFVQNVSDKPQFFGASTVTAAGATGGYEISQGGSEMFSMGDHVDLYGVCGSNNKDVVALEFS